MTFQKGESGNRTGRRARRNKRTVLGRASAGRRHRGDRAHHDRARQGGRHGACAVRRPICRASPTPGRLRAAAARQAADARPHGGDRPALADGPPAAEAADLGKFVASFVHAVERGYSKSALAFEARYEARLETAA